MFGLSLTEILVVLVLVLVVLGPDRIPQVARTAGKAIREIRKASNLIRDAVMIDDPISPKVAPRTPATPVKDNTYEAPTYVEAKPQQDIALVAMSAPRRVTEFTAVALADAAEHEAQRDVYLHIPFQETR
ncbi:MAG: twin-arginine translocase TatA/TatE family subunit [bacterium]